MNFKQIQQLIKFVSKTDVAEVNIENNNFKINIKGNSKSNFEPVTQIIQQAPTVPPTIQPVQPEPVQKSVSTSDKETNSDNYHTIKSPIIGTFYRKSAPDKPPFIEVGDTIKEGDVLCVIEAMKLFNEIESELGGTIVKILIEDASPVELDQPLFLIKPL